MDAPPLPFRDRWLAALIARAGSLYLRCVGATSRVRVHRAPGYRERDENHKPILFAFWHRHQMLLLDVHRGRGVRVLVSRSRDGEFVARALHRMGFQTARGSSSRGGGAAFRDLWEGVQRGESVAFTPDGPRGPFRSVQPGVVALAVRTGVPVVPVAWAGSRVKELKSWDRFLVPLPFARYEVVYGDPVFLAEEGPAAAARVRDAIDAAGREAERRLGESPC
jgi:lysophospholipid acyltransferase (LPLAT)-like uncharacterized protein